MSMASRQINTGRICNKLLARGFTLLEVIAAMTLLAIGITGVLAAISACLRNCESASEYSRGVFLAQQVVAQLDRATTMTDGTQTGTYDDLDVGASGTTAGTTTTQATSAGSLVTGYTWTAVISPADSEGLYPAVITVQWEAGQRQYVLSTLLRPHALLPAPAPAGAAGSSGGSGGSSSGGSGGTSSGGGSSSGGSGNTHTTTGGGT